MNDGGFDELEGEYDAADFATGGGAAGGGGVEVELEIVSVGAEGGVAEGGVFCEAADERAKVGVFVVFGAGVGDVGGVLVFGDFSVDASEVLVDFGDGLVAFFGDFGAVAGEDYVPGEDVVGGGEVVF